MKITREEFKELVKLHENTYELGREAEKYINLEGIYDMIYPIYDWIELKLNFLFSNGEDGLLWETHNKSPEELDEIYDEWLEDEYKQEAKTNE